MDRAKTRRPAEVFHPSEYILDALKEGGMELRDLAIDDTDFLAWELYMEIGKENPGVLLGENSIQRLSEVFGTGKQVWRNLQLGWLVWLAEGEQDK